MSQIALHPSIRFPLRRLPPVHYNLLHSVFHLAMSPSIHPPIAVSAHHQTSYTVYHIAASSWSSDRQPQVVNEIGSNQYILIIRCVDGCHYLTSNTIYPGVEPAGNIWPARVHQHRVCRLERLPYCFKCSRRGHITGYCSVRRFWTARTNRLMATTVLADRRNAAGTTHDRYAPCWRVLCRQPRFWFNVVIDVVL